jgi:fructokinase
MSPKIIGLGEVLWDLLPAGPQLGGAPANFAYHANALGAQALVISRVGNDDLGRAILDRFGQIGLPTGTVQIDAQAPTGTVTVQLSGQGLPRFVIHERVAWDRLELTPAAQEEVRTAEAICFGSLAQRDPCSRAAIQSLMAAAPARALRVFDINLRQNFYSREIIGASLRLANVLKLNDGELPVVAGMFALTGSTEAQLQQLQELFELRTVVLTRGAEGSLLFHDAYRSEQGPKPVSVVDTVGAGDAFTAALVLGLIRGRKVDDIHASAAELAAYVCSQPGATPELPEPLRERIAR